MGMQPRSWLRSIVSAIVLAAAVAATVATSRPLEPILTAFASSNVIEFDRAHPVAELRLAVDASPGALDGAQFAHVGVSLVPQPGSSAPIARIRPVGVDDSTATGGYWSCEGSACFHPWTLRISVPGGFRGVAPFELVAAASAGARWEDAIPEGAAIEVRVAPIVAPDMQRLAEGRFDLMTGSDLARTLTIELAERPRGPLWFEVDAAEPRDGFESLLVRTEGGLPADLAGGGAIRVPTTACRSGPCAIEVETMAFTRRPLVSPLDPISLWWGITGRRPVAGAVTVSDREAAVLGETAVVPPARIDATAHTVAWRARIDIPPALMPPRSFGPAIPELRVLLDPGADPTTLSLAHGAVALGLATLGDAAGGGWQGLWSAEWLIEGTPAQTTVPVTCVASRCHVVILITASIGDEDGSVDLSPRLHVELVYPFDAPPPDATFEVSVGSIA